VIILAASKNTSKKVREFVCRPVSRSLDFREVLCDGGASGRSCLVDRLTGVGVKVIS
jgi:hypothetical protein